MMRPLLIVGLAWLTLLMHSNAMADAEIRFVRVEGPFVRVSAEQLRTRVAEVADRGYFAVDLDLVRQSVEQMPWIRKAVVTREWPDTLRVRVEEHQPMAHWNGQQLIDQDGNIFMVPMQSPIRGLPQLSGPDGALQTVVERYHQLDQALRRVGDEIGALETNERGGWTVHLTSGTQLKLGGRDLQLRISRYLRAHDKIGALPRRVDLRYPNGLAVLPATEPGEMNDGS